MPWKVSTKTRSPENSHRSSHLSLVSVSSDMADNRIAKYVADFGPLISAATESERSASKCASETRKLCTWLQKHQDETLSKKAQLVELSSVLYKLAVHVHLRAGTDDLKLFDQICSLHESLMSMPEGRLISGSGKQKVLRALEALRGMDASQGGDSSMASTAPRAPTEVVWDLIDLSIDPGGRAILSVMDPASGDDTLVTVQSQEVAAKLQRAFVDQGAAIQVRLFVADEAEPVRAFRFNTFEVVE